MHQIASVVYAGGMTIGDISSGRKDIKALQEALGDLGSRDTMSHAVARQLKGLIIDGTFRPGARIPVAEIASAMRLSVTPVRDALRLLATEGLVVVAPRRGVWVTALSGEDIEIIYGMRVGLESLCARDGAMLIGETGLATMRATLDEMATADESDDLERFLELDRQFHGTLYAAAGRARLEQTIADLRARSQRYLLHVFAGWEPRERRVTEHEEILAAVVAGDPQLVADLTRLHVDRATERLLKQAPDFGGSPDPSRSL